MARTVWFTNKAMSTAARLSRIAFGMAMLGLCCVGGLLQAKSVQVTQLEAEISQLNKQAEYETSLKKALDFVNTPAIPDEDAYYGTLCLANTYKYISDYDNVLLYLDKAQAIAAHMPADRQFYLDDVTCQKAFALFDIQHYAEAEVLMQSLAVNHYANLGLKSQAILVMQEAYLRYLDGQYDAAEQQYDLAIVKMQAASPCDLPIVYGKQIALFGAMQDERKMQQAYRQAFRCADSCQISKYNLYATEMMRNTYQRMGNYEMAFRYFTVYDSLNTIYNADGYKVKLQELEVEFETHKKEQAIELNQKTIVGNRRLIALLIAAIVALVLIIALYITLQRRKKLEKEKQQSQLFTTQLLNNIEQERKRIATDLHDSVNNELLLVKSGLQKNTPGETASKIDALLNHVRAISRNLHPVLFEDLGLQDSIEQLVERVQEHNRFILNAEIDYHRGLGSADELQLYRIIQEAVSNIIKYAKAGAAIITLEERKERLVVVIKDNGKGFHVAETLNSKDAFGLHNIIERSKAIHGKASIVSNAQGTTITIEIPLHR
jgi:signal transduction histidine kinase